MLSTPTPHIEAKFGEIAKTVIMPGDPLRAKFIAENYLENAKCFNKIRNNLGYTGTYKNKEVSVMASGMGMPSMAIYSHELYNFYGVQNIVRVGSAGSIKPTVKIGDVVIAMGASTDSNYFAQHKLNGTLSHIASYELLKKAEHSASELGLKTLVGNIFSTDSFYNYDKSEIIKWGDFGILALEMEAAALYINAAKTGKNALCIVTVTDDLINNTRVSSQERQTGFGSMIKLTLGML